MKISVQWLQEYFKEPLPPVETLRDVLTMHAFEIEEVLEKEGDSIVDVKVLPNRAHDCLSYMGIARELAVLLDAELAFPSLSFVCDPAFLTADHVNLSVENSHLVPRAAKRLVGGIEVKESPEWLKKKLSAHGQRSVNVIVDITNLVMLETAQPVHAFDLDALAGANKKNISVRKALLGERLTTLDGKEYLLDEDALVISDEAGALDIAGIKGGQHSGITSSTKTILLSVCNFNPSHIRRTSKKLNLRTDASMRFEHGISPELVSVAMERASALIAEYAQGVVASDIVEVYPKERIRTAAAYKIGASLSEINSLLGSSFKEVDVTSVLDRLKKHAQFDWKKVDPIQEIITIGKTLEGVPYKYGASVSYDSPHFFDCSSLINYLYIQAGIALPRLTVDQYVFGTPVTKEELQAGDVVFSRNHDEKEMAHIERLGVDQLTLHTQSKEFLKGTLVPEGLDHNGLYLGDGKILHASGKWHKGRVVVEELEESPAFKHIVGYRRYTREGEERLVVDIPYERLDMRAGNAFLASGNREDLIEEIGRIYGYEHIAATLPDEAHPKPVVNKNTYYTDKIRTALVDLGFSEVYTYAFVERGTVEIENPIAADKRFMRPDLSVAITQSLAQNAKNAPLLGLEIVKIFEIGNIFMDAGNGVLLERLSLAFGVMPAAKKKGDAVLVKEILEEAAKEISLLLGLAIDVKENVSVIEVDLTAMLSDLPTSDSYKEYHEQQAVIFSPISPYPFVLRDIAIFVPDATSSEKVQRVIETAAGELLARTSLFDTFKKTFPDGSVKISYAFRLVFLSHEKTLSDAEVNEVMARVESALKSNAVWEVR